MPGTVLGILDICSHVVFVKNLWSRYYYFYFIEKEIQFTQLDWFYFLFIFIPLIHCYHNYTHEKNKAIYEKLQLKWDKTINRHQYWHDKHIWIIKRWF